jgi:transposase
MLIQSMMNRSLLKRLPEQVIDIIEETKPFDSRDFILMAQDEARFGRISGAKKSWAPDGIRPLAPRQIVRKYTYAYSAVCPSTGEITSLILPYGNTQMMNLFLKHVSEEFKNYNIVMLLDQAGWHRSNSLTIPQNIKLIKQPSHSPELNPVEHIWDEIREKHFHNKAFHSMDEVEDALCLRLNKLKNNQDYVRSLTNFPYLDITL